MVWLSKTFMGAPLERWFEVRSTLSFVCGHPPFALAHGVHCVSTPALGYTCIPAVADQSGGDPVDAFMLQAAAQGKYVAAVADAMRTPTPTPNEVSRVARMAEDLIDATTSLLAVLRGRMRKAPGGVA